MDNFHPLLRKIISEHPSHQTVSLETIYSLLGKISAEQLFTYSHPFFSKIESFKPADIAKILSPFYFAVNYWLTNLQDFRQRLVEFNDEESASLVQENINDETGIQEDILYLEKYHTITYINFLLSLGCRDKIVLSLSVQEFITGLENSLNINDLGKHACILGAIEFFYVEISSILKTYCDNNKIGQEHYSVHEILDKKHSMDFFKIAIGHNIGYNDYLSCIDKGFTLLWNIYQGLILEH